MKAYVLGCHKKYTLCVLSFRSNVGSTCYQEIEKGFSDKCYKLCKGSIVRQCIVNNNDGIDKSKLGIIFDF